MNLTLARPSAADRDLLRAFLADRSEPAFAELVRRHGAVVFGVCRRVLGDRHDAEDAFQAAFLVLARKAADVRKPEALGSWLYGVAYRTARELRHMRDRRRRKEDRGARIEEQEQTGLPSIPDPHSSLLSVLLDEELARLPDHYRQAIVLCELQGRSRKQAAAELGVPEGTLSSRLAMAKKQLAERLTRRGLAATTVTLSALLANEAAARAPTSLTLETARVPFGDEVLPAVARVADCVIKGLFVTKLQGLAVVVGVLVIGLGGWAMVPAGVGASPQAPARAVEEDASALVKQLGSPVSSQREAAERKLRALGEQALPAIRAGMNDPDTEVARRCKSLRDGVNRDRMWAAFARLAGDDKPARDLYAAILARPRAVAAIEAVLEDPSRADELYRDRTAELLRMAGGYPAIDKSGKPAVPDPIANEWMVAPPLPLAEVAGWMFLGTFQSGTGPWTAVTHKGWASLLSSHIPFLPEDDYTSAMPIAKEYEGSMASPLKKLTAAWTLRRRENDSLRAGLTLAIRYDIPESLAAARSVLRSPGEVKVEPQNMAAAIVLVGLHGGKDDLPLLARHTADDRVFLSVLDSSVKINEFAPPEVMDGRDLTCQVRDAAAATLCKLAGRDPSEFGFLAFPKVKHPSGRPTSLSSATAVGFKSKAARDAAFAKANDWLKSLQSASDVKPEPETAALVRQLGSPAFRERDEAEKKLRALGPKALPAVRAGRTDADTEIARRCQVIAETIRSEMRRDFAGKFNRPESGELDHPVWARFRGVTGATAESRKLFASVIADPRRFQMLDDAEDDPAAAATHYRWAVAQAAMTGFANWNAVDTYKPPPLADMVLCLALGGYESTGSVVPVVIGANAPAERFAFLGADFYKEGMKTPAEPALRKLYAAWLAHRTHVPVLQIGLDRAISWNINESLPTARRLLREPKARISLKVSAMTAIAKFGNAADDTASIDRFADDTTEFHAVTYQKVGYKAQVRDVAVATRLKLGKKDPRAFGFQTYTGLAFDWTQTPMDAANAFPRGFENEESRATAHAKANKILDGAAKE